MGQYNPLMDFVDQNGRVNYAQLLKLINRRNQDYFISYTKHPFFIGKNLYEGMLYKRQLESTKTEKIKRIRPDDTCFFEKEMIDNEGKVNSNASISHAVFMLRKKLYSKDLKNIVTIGRAIENDLVVADYSISRKHAQVTIYYGKYYITDLGSVNKTCVNGKELQPDKKVELTSGMFISFGRMVFLWLDAVSLYQMLRTPE